MSLLVLMAVVGVMVLATVTVDVLRTVVDVTHGGGPVTGRASRRVWNLLVGWSHRGLPAAALRTAGLLLVVAIVAAWVAGLAAGWTLIYLSDPTALMDATTGASANVIDRLYFAAGGMFSLSLGDIVPGSSAWRLVAAVNVGSGLLLLTLSITYAVPVIEAATRRRTLASAVWMLGGTTMGIVASHRAVGTGRSSTLMDELASLRRSIIELAHLHLAYPVLHYFHSADRRAAFGPSLAALYDALLVLEYTLPDAAGDHRPAIVHTRSTVEAFLEAFLLNPPDERCTEPPLPDIAAFTPGEDVAVGRAGFELAMTAHGDQRRELAALVREEGWAWADVNVAPGWVSPRSRPRLEQRSRPGADI